MLEQGELTMSEIAAELGIGRSTLNRHLARHRAEKDGQATVSPTPGGGARRDTSPTGRQRSRRDTSRDAAAHRRFP